MLVAVTTEDIGGEHTILWRFNGGDLTDDAAWNGIALVDSDGELVVDLRLVDFSGIVPPENSIGHVAGKIRIGDGAHIGGVSAGLPGEGVNFLVVQQGATPLENGVALREAYAAAKLLTPNGLPLAADNRSVVLIPPGVYDMGDSIGSYAVGVPSTPYALDMDAEFVDFQGLASKEHATITASPGVATLLKSSDDSAIRHLTLTGVKDGNNSFCVAMVVEGGLDLTVVEDLLFTDDPSGTPPHIRGGVSGFWRRVFFVNPLSQMVGVAGSSSAALLLEDCVLEYFFVGVGFAGRAVRCKFQTICQSATISGTLIDCEATVAFAPDSDDDGFITGKLIRCHQSTGNIKAPSGGGKRILCTNSNYSVVTDAP